MVISGRLWSRWGRPVWTLERRDWQQLTSHVHSQLGRRRMTSHAGRMRVALGSRVDMRGPWEAGFVVTRGWGAPGPRRRMG